MAQYCVGSTERMSREVRTTGYPTWCYQPLYDLVNVITSQNQADNRCAQLQTGARLASFDSGQQQAYVVSEFCGIRSTLN
jgi:hypothetical protein